MFPRGGIGIASPTHESIKKQKGRNYPVKTQKLSSGRTNEGAGQQERVRIGPVEGIFLGEIKKWTIQHRNTGRRQHKKPRHAAKRKRRQVVLFLFGVL